MAAAVSVAGSTPQVSGESGERPTWRGDSRLRLALFSFAYVAAYVALDRFAVHFQILRGVSAWYLPAGLTAVLLLAAGVRAAPVALAAILLSARLNYHKPLESWGLLPGSLTILAGYLGGAALLRRSPAIDLGFRRLRDGVRFVLVMLGAAAVVASLGTLAVRADGGIRGKDFVSAAFHWWLGDSVAIVVFTPFLLVFLAPRVRTWLADSDRSSPRALGPVLDMPGPSDLGEWIVQLASIGAAVWLVVDFRPVALFDPLYGLFIPIIWIAARHGVRGAILGCLILNAVVMIAVQGSDMQLDRLPRLQLVILTISVTALFLGMVVSERRQAEQAWRESKESLRSESQLLESVLNSVGEAVVVVDAQGKYSHWNPAAERILGLWAVDAWPRPEQHDGLYLPDGVTPYPREDLPWSRAVRGESTDQVEILVRHRKRHQKIWTSVTGRPILGRDGKVSGGVAVFRDISLRKRAEEEYRTAQERLNGIYSCSVDAMGYGGLDGTLLDVNEAFLKLTGYSRDELIGRKKYQDLTPKEFAAKEAELLARVIGTGEPQEDEKEYVRTDGSRVPVLMAAFAVKGKDGTPDGIGAVIKDITERKRAEEALRRSEAELKEAQRVAHVGSWSWEIDAGVITWSDELYRIAGLDPANGPPSYEEFSRLYTPESWQRLERAVHETLRTGVPYDLEAERIRPDGSRCWVQVRGAAQRDDSGRIVALYGTSQDITERKKTEEALRQSEERFSKAFRVSPAAASISTLRDGRYVDVNESCTRILGYSREELIGRRAPDLIWADPEDRARFVGRVQRDKFVREMEAKLRTKSGEVRDTLLSAELIQIGGEECLLITTDDVTERKRAAETVRQLSLQKELILNSAGEGIYGLDLDGRVTFINPAAARMLGWDAAELPGRTQHDVLHHTKFDGSPYPEECPICAAFRDGQVHRVDTEAFWRKDGSCFPVEYTSTPILDGGRVVGAVVTFRDVTERRRTEEALRSSEARFRRVFSSAPLPMWLWDSTSWRFLEVNEAATAHYGYSRQEFLEMQVTDLLPAEEAERMKDDHRRRTDGRYLVETRQRLKNGRFIDVHLTSDLVELGGRRVRLVVAEDISERKQAEEALHQRTMELERSNADLEQFAYVASHDLQEPLRMVASFTQLLADRYSANLDDEAREFIGFAVEGATRMQALIDGLLSFARVKTRAKELHPTDCQAVFQRSLTNLRVTLQESRAEVISDLLPTVLGDESQIEQLFQNLIGNALKFSSQNTPKVGVSARRSGKEWLLAVSDNGIGIDPRYNERIFAIFQRLHSRSEYPGTGIGLAICKKIVERHGGRIWVESELGQGATFFFTLSAVDGMRV